MTSGIRGLLILAGLLAASVVQALSLSGGDSQFGGNDLPDVDQAIRISAQADWEHRQVLASFSLMDQVYLYKKRLDFTLLDDRGEVLQHFPAVNLPEGEDKNDDVYGHVSVYYDHLDVTLPVSGLPDGTSQLRVRYQGCLEDKLCYPPETRTFDLAAPSASAATTRTATAADPGKGSTDRPRPDSGFVDTLFSEDAGAFSAWMRDQNLALVLSLFFLGGILLAFTPCVFPMVPILSGIIAGEKTPSARRGFLLSVAYVLGMAVPYTLAGLLVALFGAGLNLQFLLQQPAAIIVSAAMFVLLALAMFGHYELQLPAGLRHRLHHIGPQGGGSMAGAAVLGAISALVVSPCVTPILAGALVYVAGSGDALTGALSLFALALGMGVPLIIVGTGGGHLLPRAGHWMDEVKRFFGVVMLGVAIWLLGRIVSDTVTLGLYGLLLVLYGVQLGALEAVPEGGSRLKRGAALVLALYGVTMLVGAAAGGGDPARPLAPFTTASETTASAAPGAGSGPAARTTDDQDAHGWHTLEGGDALAAALKRSAARGRPVLVDFFAEWCVACKELDKNTLSKARVKSAMTGFDLYRVDITEISDANRELMSDYRIFGLPCLIFFDGRGREIDGARVLGEMGPDRFLRHIEQKVKPALGS